MELRTTGRTSRAPVRVQSCTSGTPMPTQQAGTMHSGALLLCSTRRAAIRCRTWRCSTGRSGGSGAWRSAPAASCSRRRRHMRRLGWIQHGRQHLWLSKSSPCAQRTRLVCSRASLRAASHGASCRLLVLRRRRTQFPRRWGRCKEVSWRISSACCLNTWQVKTMRWAPTWTS